VALLERLHQFDVLRANKAPFAWGLEPRVPFLDKAFLDVSMGLDPAEKMARPSSAGHAHVRGRDRAGGVATGQSPLLLQVQGRHIGVSGHVHGPGPRREAGALWPPAMRAHGALRPASAAAVGCARGWSSAAVRARPMHVWQRGFSRAATLQDSLKCDLWRRTAQVRMGRKVRGSLCDVHQHAVAVGACLLYAAL